MFPFFLFVFKVERRKKGCRNPVKTISKKYVLKIDKEIDSYMALSKSCSIFFDSCQWRICNQYFSGKSFVCLFVFYEMLKRGPR